MPRKRRRKPSRRPQLLALSGFAILVIAFILFKSSTGGAQTSSFTPEPGQLAETQLDQALEAGRPVLAFFHSNNCQQCLIMMDTVARIFPEYQDQVVLVDVDVYSEFNRPLLSRVRLQYIPTLIFYDRAGESQTRVGVLADSLLREQLSAISAGP
jgi:thiol-disulfide isomerase/thioredoxin